MDANREDAPRAKEESEWVSRFRDLVRYLSAKRRPDTWRAEAVALLRFMRTILANAANGNTNDLRFENEKIRKNLVDDEGVLNFFLRVTPYCRLHVVGDNVNEFVFRLKPDSALRCAELVSAIDALLEEEENNDPWWESLSLTVRLTTPDGSDMLGKFSPDEIVHDINEWASRRVPLGNAVLGDHELLLDDATTQLANLDINRRCLRFKLEGDLGQAKMAEMDARRRKDAEFLRAKQEASFAKARQSKEEARRKVEAGRLKNLKQFHEDRQKVEEKVTRVLGKSSGKQPSRNSTESKKL